MIGHSSSHTAGAVRIGLMSRLLLGSPAIKAHNASIRYTGTAYKQSVQFMR